MNSWYNLLGKDCSIRAYQLLPTIFHKCMNTATNTFYIFPIMLALYICLMLLMSHYAQNYAIIIDVSLGIRHVIRTV